MEKNKYNILFSTTRQWNPGDEFILFGIINLLKEAGIKFNLLIYNRNPEVRAPFDRFNPLRKLERDFKGKSILESFFRIGRYDNSFREKRKYSKNIDLVIFAGSPAWYSRNLFSLYKTIEKQNLPTLYLGIGSHEEFKWKDFPNLVRKTLKSSYLVTTRDRRCKKGLEEIKPYYLPCPALFSVDNHKSIKEVDKIGIVYMTSETVKNNRVSRKKERFLNSLYKNLIEKSDNEIGIICHYIDELFEAENTFPNIEKFYSYDASDYKDYYSNFDLIITPRVHGAGISSALGIPSIYLSHDKRSGTVEGFKSRLVSSNDIESVFEAVSEVKSEVRGINENLIQNKNKNKTKYLSLIREAFEKL